MLAVMCSCFHSFGANHSVKHLLIVFLSDSLCRLPAVTSVAFLTIEKINGGREGHEPALR